MPLPSRWQIATTKSEAVEGKTDHLFTVIIVILCVKEFLTGQTQVSVRGNRGAGPRLTGLADVAWAGRPWI